MRKGALIFSCIFLMSWYAQAQSERYFDSPRLAVDTITELMQKADWVTLTSYYDLSTALQMDDGTPITKELLESGKYFFCSSCPASTSAVNNRYLNPFPLGLRFEKSRPSNNVTVTIVTVSREISGADGNKRKISQDIYLRKTDSGFRLLPTEFAYYTPPN